MMKYHYRVLVIVIGVLIRIGYLSAWASKIIFQLAFLKNPHVDKWTSIDVEPCDVRLDCFIRLGPIFTTPLLYCVSGVVCQFFLVFCPFNS